MTMKSQRRGAVAGIVAFLAMGLTGWAKDSSDLRELFNASIRFTDRVEFPPRVGDLGDPISGRANFGVGADGVSQDPSAALFGGVSLVAGTVSANGRTCATCHRPEARFGLPPLPLSATIPLSDVLFTGLPADIGVEPLGVQNFDTLGLLFHRPTRLNPFLAEDSPARQVFFWRKTQRLINTVFTFGLLNDGRSRELVETSRGAVFTHTQNGDLRFDDLVDVQRLRDISRFMEEQIDPPELRALLDPTDPMYQTLVGDPFATVPAGGQLERQGRDVFRRACMDCHNQPNVFSNRDHVNAGPTAGPPPYGHAFDIGVAERNALHLEFRRYDPATAQRVQIILPLIAQDGAIVNVPVVDDVGLAGTTGRYEDLHKFKVPQLRRIAQLGPYFHDNSAKTLADVVDYFNGDDYNRSPDGRQHPIRLNATERAALIAFLQTL
jgi:cytochrome c peroxidase